MLSLYPPVPFCPYSPVSVCQLNGEGTADIFENTFRNERLTQNYHFCKGPRSREGVAIP